MTIEDFKIERFKIDFPDAEFPVVHALPSEKCVDLKRKLAEKLGLATNVAPVQLLETLYNSFHIEQAGFVTTDPGFNLDTLLTESGVRTPQQVCINWNQFDHVDEIKLTDLVKYFHYFWYPSSDDIEIFDNTLRWVTLVRHDGAVRVVRLE
jgi:hypothetical protein